MVIQHLNQIRKVRKLSKWVCLTSWLKIKKIIALRCHLLLFYTQQEIISRSDCDVQWKVDFIRQLAMTSLVAGPRRSSKALPKAKLAPKNGSWSLFGGLMPVWSTTASWIPVKPLHLRSMLSKPVRCTKNCNTCCWHRATEWNPFASTTPDHMAHKGHGTRWKDCATKFCLVYHIHLTSRQPTTTSSSISTTFCKVNASPTSRRQKKLSKSSLNPKAWIFTLQE